MGFTAMHHIRQALDQYGCTGAGMGLQLGPIVSIHMAGIRAAVSAKTSKNLIWLSHREVTKEWTLHKAVKMKWSLLAGMI